MMFTTYRLPYMKQHIGIEDAERSLLAGPRSYLALALVF